MVLCAYAIAGEDWWDAVLRRLASCNFCYGRFVDYRWDRAGGAFGLW